MGLPRIGAWPDMTLIEFLRARIDEDEAALRELFDQPRPGIGTLADPFHLTGARLLADIATKRWLIDVAILDEWTDLAESEPTSPHANLALLALPYSAHQDYLEEWRPS